MVAFLTSEVVLSPVVSGCLPSCGDGLVGVVVASEVVLSPIVSLHVGMRVLVGVVAFLAFEVVLLVGAVAFLASGVVLSPVVSLHVGMGVGWLGICFLICIARCFLVRHDGKSFYLVAHDAPSLFMPCNNFRPRIASLSCRSKSSKRAGWQFHPDIFESFMSNWRPHLVHVF